MTPANWRPSTNETFYFIQFNAPVFGYDYLSVRSGRQSGWNGIYEGHLDLLSVTGNLFRTEAEALRALADGLEKIGGIA